MQTPLMPIGSGYVPAEDQPLVHAAEEFMRAAVLPSAHPHGFRTPQPMPSLLAAASEAGLMGLDVPQEHGGLQLTWPVSLAISQATAAEPSFAISQGVHTGVATLPILLFGNLHQHRHWLPQLAEGRRIGAFALTEAHAGSDIGALRAKAEPHAGGYLLTGDKMWITNAAYAGIFTVFAHTPQGLTALLVPAETSGVAASREEHKIGLKGSSTTRVTFQQAKIPPENVLGSPGSGARIALTTLNIGRLKLSATALGIARRCLHLTQNYVEERAVFGEALSRRALTKLRLTKMAERISTAEHTLYRTSLRLQQNWYTDPAAASAGISLECALLKPLCTETLDFCADTAVQLHGGYGYSEEFEIARLWRDARVFRIFEGTNEVNRLSAARAMARMSLEELQARISPKGAEELWMRLRPLQGCTITDERQVEMEEAAMLAEKLFAQPPQ
jgi:alkylation response protein AidB-like acyl-CoA dehydrogenase